MDAMTLGVLLVLAPVAGVFVLAWLFDEARISRRRRLSEWRDMVEAERVREAMDRARREADREGTL